MKKRKGKKRGRKSWWLRPQSTHPYAKLKKAAWDAISLAIRIEENWTCITCGIQLLNSSQMQCGHYISRRKMGTFFERRNLAAQCRNCNYNMHNGQIHSIFAEKLIERYGVNVITELNRLAAKIKKYSREELLAIINKYNVK